MNYSSSQFITVHYSSTHACMMQDNSTSAATLTRTHACMMHITSSHALYACMMHLTSSYIQHARMRGMMHITGSSNLQSTRHINSSHTLHACMMHMHPSTPPPPPHPHTVTAGMPQLQHDSSRRRSAATPCTWPSVAAQLRLTAHRMLPSEEGN